jgi:hypothetical protein
MKTLKYLCVLFGLLLIAAAFTGIQSVSITPSGATITKFNIFGRICCLAEAFVLATFAYGIHIRARITWKAGFILWALNYIYFVAAAVNATYHVAPIRDIPSFFLPAGLIVLGGAAVGIYWGVWWKRQRPYFFQDPQNSN